MKKLITCIFLSVIMLTLSGCIVSPQEYFNEKDERDFKDGASVNFELIQFQQVFDKETLKQMQLDGTYFLFLGGVSASSEETTKIVNKYFAYLKNRDGGIYFAQIPAEKVRVYEDADDVPHLVAYESAAGGDVEIHVNEESDWS